MRLSNDQLCQFQEDGFLLVRDFFHEASAAGLAYLGDAIPAATSLELLPDEVRDRAAGLHPGDVQQLVDFVKCTAFRRALLVRADEARQRSWCAPVILDRGAIESLSIASRLRPHDADGRARPVEAFEDGTQTVQVSNAVLRRALHELSRAAPAALSFKALAGRTAQGASSSSVKEQLGSELVDLWLATGSIDLLAAPPLVAPEAGARPVACGLARWHASHGGVVTNRLHQEVMVPDAVVRWVLSRLDGTRTRRDLAREARTLDEHAAPSLGPQRGPANATDTEVAQLIDACVERVAACALLVPSDDDPPPS